eukprot:scpid91307/ scgid16088/ 
MKRVSSSSGEGAPSPKQSRLSVESVFELKRTVPRGFLKEYRADLDEHHRDVLTVLNGLAQNMRSVLLRELEVQQFKTVLVTCIMMERSDASGATVSASPFFRSSPISILNPHGIDDQLSNAFGKIISKVDGWLQAGSGWTVVRVRSVHIDIAKYLPMRGSSYLPLPQKISKTKGVINVRNTDDQCLKWALLSALHPAEKDAQRVTKYQSYAQSLNFDDVDFPATLADVYKVSLDEE